MVSFVPSHSAGQSCSLILLTTLPCVRLNWERWPNSFRSLKRGTQRSSLFPVTTWKHTRDGLRTLRYCFTSITVFCLFIFLNFFMGMNFEPFVKIKTLTKPGLYETSQCRSFKFLEVLVFVIHRRKINSLV